MLAYYTIYCVTIPTRPPCCIDFFKTIQSWPVNHLVVPIGVSHISSWLQEIQSREWEKITKNKRTIWAWVNSSARRLSCDTLHSWCICRLTLACISSEISTKLPGMPTHPDWPSLTASGLNLMPTGLFCCLVSTANCPSPSPVANCLLWIPSSYCWPGFPYPLPVTSKSRAQAFVWFRAKTDKGIVCLAHPLHSVTIDHLIFFSTWFPLAILLRIIDYGLNIIGNFSVLFVAFRWDSFSVLRFPVQSHVLVFSYEISPICRLKYPSLCFSSHFYFLMSVFVFCFFYILILPMLLKAGVISFSLLFLMQYSCLCVDAILTYYNFTLLRVIHAFINGWSFTGSWVTASLLKSPWLFLVFWQILIMLLFIWFPLALLFSYPSVLVSILWGLYRAHQFQLVSPSLSCSIVFSVL